MGGTPVGLEVVGQVLARVFQLILVENDVKGVLSTEIKFEFCAWRHFWHFDYLRLDIVPTSPQPPFAHSCCAFGTFRVF